jgi:DNA processing protein
LRLLYYYWISSTPGIGAVRAHDIIEFFGSVEKAWNADNEAFTKIKGISQAVANNIISRRNESKLLKEMKDIRDKGIRLVTIGDDEYPDRLRHLFTPPCMLYIKGRMRECTKYIAVVGSRKCTGYGRMVARDISSKLSKYNIGIISGLARGIDTEAHKGALDAGGFTCAVLGCGLDIIYPPENGKLMKEMEYNGTLISEYPPGTLPLAGNFPARNRIISGLSDGVLVVEAGEKSGALITVDYALEQGIDVFAIPGSILSNQSRGTNLLIKDGAKPVLGVEDILCEFNIDQSTGETHNEVSNLSQTERRLMDIIKDSPVNTDDLLQEVHLKVSEMNSILTWLELKGIVKILPGNYVVRVI